ncbi:MAG: hypothetical protein HXX11_17260 [Desulfuromonadales bacterium]|nr:hypothetical protein [Desulfuromonadales bacterium]
MLGPSSLDHRLIRRIIKQKKHNNFVKLHNRGKIKWNDKSLSALKQEIRLALRSQQEGRCIYCRRIVKIERRNAYEAIEHFLDKSKTHYLKWSFSCVNLSLSCHPCNIEKSTRDMGDASVQVSPCYTSTAGEYKWLHPYFDDYHSNIEIKEGWVYKVKPNAPQRTRAFNLITECKLDQICSIEAHSEKFLNSLNRLTLLMGKALEKGQIERCRRLQQISLKLQHDFNPLGMPVT